MLAHISSLVNSSTLSENINFSLAHHSHRGFPSSEQNKPNKIAKLTDLNIDNIQLVFAKLPLETRFHEILNVNSQWTEIVKNMLATQKKLTLRIGNENRWKMILRSIKSQRLLINAVNPFDSLTAAHLSDELTAFLSSTFPRLQSLAVVVDDQVTEHVHFLHYLPQLISFYADTLTTLQLVLKVKNVTFLAIFNSLIASIDGLHKLTRLSICDVGNSLKVPLFDLPHLLSSTLETLDFNVLKSPKSLASNWETSLQARQCNNPGSLLKINYPACLQGKSSLSFSLSANVAIHFYTLSAHIRTAADLEHLTGGVFTNLRKLFLRFSDTLSVGKGLAQLSKLLYLTDLCLICNNLKEIEYPANRPIPVLPAIQRLYLSPFNKESLHDLVNTEALRPWEVFPNAQQISLCLHTNHCASCGWEMKVDNENKTKVVKGGEDLVKQCVTRMVAPFVTGKTKPKLGVSFCKKKQFVMSYLVDFDSDGQMKLQARYTSA